MFPRVNSALSEYLKTSRARTGASVALTIAAAAGVGVASTAASAQPWTASLNSMTQHGHSSDSPKIATVAGSSRPAGEVAGTHAAPVAPSAPATHGAVKVDADQKADQATHKAAAPAAPAKPATPAAPVKAKAGPEGLLPSKHAAPAQKPAAPAHKALAPKKAAPPKPAAPSKPAAPAKPYTMYDSTTPGTIPSGQSNVAVYANGAFQASWGSVSGRHHVLWIDANGGDPGCDVLDVEPGDASPSTAATWVQNRENQHPGSVAIVYTMLSEWSAVKSAVGALPGNVKSHVRYWIADPTGQAHIVPGSSATQWSWGTSYDTTEALPNFDN